MNHPEVVDRLAILNAAHPRKLSQGLHNPDQLRRSWYFFFFAVPGGSCLHRTRSPRCVTDLSSGGDHSGTFDQRLAPRDQDILIGRPTLNHDRLPGCELGGGQVHGHGVERLHRQPGERWLEAKQVDVVVAPKEVGVERAQTPRGEQHRDRQHRSGDEEGDVDLGDGEQ